MGHLNSAKHRASHGGYKQKPSRQAVVALLNLYAGVSKLPEVITPRKLNPGVQLKLFMVAIAIGISPFSNSQTYKTVGDLFTAKIPSTFVCDKLDSSPDYSRYQSSSKGIKMIEFNSLNISRFESSDAQHLYNQAVKSSSLKISYKIQKSNWFIISGTKENGNIVYWKRVVGDNFISDLYIEYNSSNKNIIEPYIGEISRSFTSL